MWGAACSRGLQLKIVQLVLTLSIARTARPFPPHRSLLRTPLQVAGSNKLYWARDVPGDGSCLFHSLAAAIKYQELGFHPEFDKALYAISDRLRQLAVDTLEFKNASLYLGEGEVTTTADILAMICAQFNTTASGYCHLMRRPREWGGGPEIVALSNLFQLPIHVYELHTRRIWPRTFQLRESARFGSPLFDTAGAPPICILCVDGRFPNIKPGHQKNVGDHFMPLFCVSSLRDSTGANTLNDSIGVWGALSKLKEDLLGIFFNNNRHNYGVRDEYMPANRLGEKCSGLDNAFAAHAADVVTVLGNRSVADLTNISDLLFRTARDISNIRNASNLRCILTDLNRCQ